MLRVGVLAMQGAFEAHLGILRSLGADAFCVRTSEELAQCQAIVLPGGESTAIRKALVRSGLYEPLGERIRAGLPTLATCAGMIVIAHSAPDGAPATYGILDIDVTRNGYGSQRQSFEADVVLNFYGLHSDLSHQSVANGVFIRAPRIDRVGDDVAVVGVLEGEPVAVLQGNIIATTWHPELNEDSQIHRWFVEMARNSSGLSRVAVPAS